MHTAPLIARGRENISEVPPPRRGNARLASRAALTYSGVRTSGSDSLTFALARDTCRLCRFNSL